MLYEIHTIPGDKNGEPVKDEIYSLNNKPYKIK